MLHQRLQSLQQTPCSGSKNPQLSPKFPVRTDTIFKTTVMSQMNPVYNSFSLYFTSFAAFQMEWFIRIPYQYFLICTTATRIVHFTILLFFIQIIFDEDNKQCNYSVCSFFSRILHLWPNIFLTLFSKTRCLLFFYLNKNCMEIKTRNC